MDAKFEMSINGTYNGSGDLLCVRTNCNNHPKKYVSLDGVFLMLCQEHYDEFLKDFYIYKAFEKNDSGTHLSFFWWRH